MTTTRKNTFTTMFTASERKACNALRGIVSEYNAIEAINEVEAFIVNTLNLDFSWYKDYRITVKAKNSNKNIALLRVNKRKHTIDLVTREDVVACLDYSDIEQVPYSNGAMTSIVRACTYDEACKRLAQIACALKL